MSVKTAGLFAALLFFAGVCAPGLCAQEKGDAAPLWYAGIVTTGTARTSSSSTVSKNHNIGGVIVSITPGNAEEAGPGRRAYHTTIYFVPSSMASKVLKEDRVSLTERELRIVARKNGTRLFAPFINLPEAGGHKLLRFTYASVAEQQEKELWWGVLVSPAFVLWASNEKEVELPVFALAIPGPFTQCKFTFKEEAGGAVKTVHAEQEQVHSEKDPEYFSRTWFRGRAEGVDKEGVPATWEFTITGVSSLIKKQDGSEHWYGHIAGAVFRVGGGAPAEDAEDEE